jgi:hypothetical protein
MTTTHEPKMIPESYPAAWNETDDARRRALLEVGWTPDARYVDPPSCKARAATASRP